MIPGSKNKNGSSWVTARHGGDGKGHASPHGTPSPINHHGAVNAPKGPRKPTPTHPAYGSHAQQNQEPEEEEQQEQEWENPEAEKTPELHPYHEEIAKNLQDNHGLNRNKAVRVAAGIVRKHAGGHAAVDAEQQRNASQAHQHFTNLMKKHKKASAVSAPQHAM